MSIFQGRIILMSKHQENMKTANITRPTSHAAANSNPYLNTHIKLTSTQTKTSNQTQQQATAMEKLVFTIYLMLLCTSTIFFTASAQCQGDFQGLIQECSRFVQKQGPQQSPSQACCDVVRNVDLPCVCQHVTSQVERIISMQKAAFVSASCGKPLARGTKCGSKKSCFLK